MKKEKKFKKVIKWGEGKDTFDSAFDFCLSSCFFLIGYIFVYGLFGWAFGIYEFAKCFRRSLKRSREIYWVEIKEAKK